jgi:hypothetical protein
MNLPLSKDILTNHTVIVTADFKNNPIRTFANKSVAPKVAPISVGVFQSAYFNFSNQSSKELRLLAFAFAKSSIVCLLIRWTFIYSSNIQLSSQKENLKKFMGFVFTNEGKGTFRTKKAALEAAFDD